MAVKKWRKAVLLAYALACVGLMFMLPMNKFEWMLEEPEALAAGLTFCGLPVDHNGDARIFSWLLLFPLWGVAVMQARRGGAGHNVRRGRHALWIAAAVSAVWLWRYFVHYPLC